jgi:hypothetical protein
MGQQERIGLVNEIIGRDIEGRLLKQPHTIRHAGISTVSLFRFDPPTLSVPQD